MAWFGAHYMEFSSAFPDAPVPAIGWTSPRIPSVEPNALGDYYWDLTRLKLAVPLLSPV